MSEIVSGAAIRLGKRSAADFEFVINYAIKHRIELKSRQFVQLPEPSFSKYIEYFNAHLSDVTKMKCYTSLLDNVSYCPSREFTILLNGLFKFNLQDTNQFRSIPINADLRSSLKDAVKRATQLASYEDFIKLLNLQSMPHLFEPIDPVNFVSLALSNVDGRVFDYCYNKHGETMKVASLTLTTHKEVNVRSLFKMFKMARANASETGGQFYLYRLLNDTHSIEHLAFIGALKDP